jgi:signal transduction histidine kinase
MFNVKGGKVEISAYREDGMVKVCVKDTGIGIPKEKMGKLFEKCIRLILRPRENLKGSE